MGSQTLLACQEGQRFLSRTAAPEAACTVLLASVACAVHEDLWQAKYAPQAWVNVMVGCMSGSSRALPLALQTNVQGSGSAHSVSVVHMHSYSTRAEHAQADMVDQSCVHSPALHCSFTNVRHFFETALWQVGHHQ